MEERILDEEEGRGIRLKRTQDGETDAVEDIGADEVTVELPEEGADGDYDEDLVGLTPSRLKEELEKREKAQKEAIAESKKLTDEAADLYEQGNFEQAAPLYLQATLYDADNEDAARGYFAAVTHGFTDTEGLFSDEAAEEISALGTGRKAVVEHLGDKLRRERAAYSEEEEALSPVFAAKQEERRSAFSANRKHYIVLTSISLFLCAAFAIATAIGADNILRTQSVLPIVLTAVFGVIAFAALGATAVFGMRLFAAMRLCGANEKLSSTADGQRLLFLRERIGAIDTILGEGDKIS